MQNLPKNVQIVSIDNKVIGILKSEQKKEELIEEFKASMFRKFGISPDKHFAFNETDDKVTFTSQDKMMLYSIPRIEHTLKFQSTQWLDE
ncbi:MAG: hypothetical protein EBU93_07375 [Chlamydiae bacterium]|nr:hypothetical protein [Chlamydiota bacterium]